MPGIYIATIPNRSSPPALLLRQSYRQGRQGKPGPWRIARMGRQPNLPPGGVSSVALAWWRLQTPLRWSAASRLALAPPSEVPCAAWARGAQRGQAEWASRVGCGHDGRPYPGPAIAAGPGPRPGTCHRNDTPGRAPACRRGRRGYPVQRQGLAAAPPTPERSGPRGPAGGRPHRDVWRRASRSVGAVWPQPRRAKGQGADGGGAGVGRGGLPRSRSRGSLGTRGRRPRWRSSSSNCGPRFICSGLSWWATGVARRCARHQHHR